MPRVIDLRSHAYGLVNEQQFHVNRLLQDYDPNLSLRRVQDNDPSFNPQMPYGVWEDGLRGNVRPWVFFLSDAMIDEKVLARIVENDFTKRGADVKMARVVAQQKALDASKARRRMEADEERYDEMQVIAKLAQHHTVVRARINGERVLLGDEITSGRTHV